MTFAVVGHPLDHSKSPAMFAAAFKEFDLPHSFVKKDISPDRLPSLIKKLRSGEYSGLSITVPYKEEIIQYLDVLTPDARAIHAVNTVYMKDNKITGDNTDWIGFKKALEEAVDIEGKKILVCGAGGAARACLFALKDRKEFVTLTNRSEEKGLRLAQEFGVSFADKDSLPQTDILINATSSGLYGELPASEEYLKNIAVVFDLLYGNSLLTAAAKKYNLISIDGSDMLVYQGTEQFKRFLGIEPPIEVMRKAL